MKKKTLSIIIAMILLGIFVGGIVLADDGIMHLRNISKTPETETEDAGIKMMNFYVPAQSSSGLLTPILYQYVNDDGTLGDTMERTYAKPLVAVFIDGIEHDPVEGILSGDSINSGLGIGTRDAFVALSLDDGVTWKRENVSYSAHLSSFTLANGTEYPGDTYAAVISVEGDRVMAAWLSRYCSGGTPAYAMLSDIDEDGNGTLDDPLYPDYFGVAGSQGSVDYTLQGFPEVGEIPYGCVWTARGQLLYNEGEETAGDEIYDIAWTKPERLTSGRRDPNRLEIAGVEDAGFAIVWQEDPQGLRPGQGLGPGEGWSGAIVNAKTDIWYSVIGWDDFDDVYALQEDGTEVPVNLVDYTGDTAPKVATPMAMPIRLTDNNMCQIAGVLADVDSYCFTDFSDRENPVVYDYSVAPSADMTFCSDSIPWVNPNGVSKNICVTQDGRVLLGRVGASRPRIGMHPYTRADGTTSAWVLLGYEETKALGEGTLDDYTDVDVVDIGKNMWYHSFDMFNPDIVSHGNILNQPAVDPLTGVYFPTSTSTEAGLDFGEYEYEFYETDIARRFSLISQDIEDAGDSGVVAYGLVKSGIINQGGPADIFGRQFVIPEDYDSTSDNPYAFENMVCSEWAYKDVYNPYYPGGICLDTPTNLSGTQAVNCEDGDCPTGEEVYVCDDTGYCDFDLGLFERVTEWQQTEENLVDQSWTNPFDVAKGHRGFLSGDFLMVIYAWSPNYKLNAIGNDHYNLYVRRSFDGGYTWTTTPADLGGDGTTTCENYGWPTIGVSQTCTDYGPGVFEQARNVSQLVGSQDTILDPRYSPTENDPILCMNQGVIGDCAEGLPYDDDAVHDPSRYFIVFETGDNTTVMYGEATPQDLFYSRATNWGDDYDHEDVELESFGITVEFWDWLEQGPDESGEAGIIANPSGTFLHAAWNQALEIGDEIFTNMDAYYRRVMYADDFEPEATIEYVSAIKVFLDEDLLVTGSGRDRDYLGGLPVDSIVEIEWTHTFDGISTVVDDGDEDPFTLNMAAGSMAIGDHTFGFRVKDNEGNWSPAANADIQVRKLYRVFVPFWFDGQ